jgi:enolase
MEDPKISSITSREVLDSKGRPMVEVDVWCTDGYVGRGASPCGSSVGSHEAVVIRDGEKRFGGLGVKKAVQNVTEIIAPALMGRSIGEQRQIDHLMIELDGTPNKSRLGANAIYSVSIAVARAAAHSQDLPLYRYLSDVETKSLPVPMFNMINGGSYAGRNVEFQEFLLAPTAAKNYSEALRMGVEVFYKLSMVIKKRYGQECHHTGYSAGFAAPVNESAEIIETLLEATEEAGYGGLFKVGLDCAASHFFDSNRGIYTFRGKKIGRDEMIEFLEDLGKAYPIFMIEDPLDEEDFDGFAEMTRRMNIIIAGDDLFATNIERLKKGIHSGAANAIVLKPNMIGTLSEALDTASWAKKHGYLLIPSIRAGGGVDDPIADIAVAVGSPLMKSGAPRSGERTSCHNRLLRIEEELKESAQFPSFEVFERLGES